MTPSISVSYDAKQNTLMVIVPESYAMEELRQALCQQIDNIPVPTRFNVLLDVMRSQADRDFAEVREFISRSKELSSRVIRVAVVVNRLLHFGMANQAAFYAAMDGFVVRPFWTRSKARKWLDQLEDSDADEAWSDRDNAGT